MYSVILTLCIVYILKKYGNNMDVKYALTLDFVWRHPISEIAIDLYLASIKQILLKDIFQVGFLKCPSFKSKENI